LFYCFWVTKVYHFARTHYPKIEEVRKSLLHISITQPPTERPFWYPGIGPAPTLQFQTRLVISEGNREGERKGCGGKREKRENWRRDTCALSKRVPISFH